LQSLEAMLHRFSEDRHGVAKLGVAFLPSVHGYDRARRQCYYGFASRFNDD
jgi:hypothetical protein